MAKSPDDRYRTPAEIAEALAPFSAGADLAALFSRSREGLRTAATPPTALAATDEYHSSALAGTHPSRPALLPSAWRWRSPPIVVALLLLLGGAGLFYEIVFLLRKDNSETVLRVPDGSDVRIRPDGRVNVTLPDGETTRKSLAAESAMPDKPSVMPAVRAEPDPVPQPATRKDVVEKKPVEREPVEKKPTGKKPVEKEVPATETAPRPIPETGTTVEPPKPTVGRIVRQAMELPPGAPLSRIALVTGPAAVKGARSWTVETRSHRGAVDAVAYSPDGE